MTNITKIAFAAFWAYCFLNFLFLAFTVDRSRHRIEKLEHELHQLRMKIGEIKDVHVCEVFSHEDCKFDCDCSGVFCKDTL